ncbi:MAG: hypothetical protein MRY83_22065 [Flavobacteriales bacterium]|nr:hypothetical protein [Flavobacteriales bacterium]
MEDLERYCLDLRVKGFNHKTIERKLTDKGLNHKEIERLILRTDKAFFSGNTKPIKSSNQKSVPLFKWTALILGIALMTAILMGFVKIGFGLLMILFLVLKRYKILGSVSKHQSIFRK